MKKGKVLRMYDTKAVFESIETGNCLIANQTKEGIGRELQLIDKTHVSELGQASQIVHFESIFGFYGLLSGTYVALIIDSEPFVNISNIDIRKAKKFAILPLFRNSRPLSEVKQADENRYLELLHSAFTEHNFFFSSKFHVTLTQQRQSLINVRDSLDPLWANADPRFFWNRDVIIDLIALDADEWITPFMSAYIESQQCEVEGEKFTLLLISRRSRYRQGCRFTKRGLDENGNVANFVETEQILLFPNEKITSFVQIRGSIPYHWASPVSMKYDPSVLISNDRGRCSEWASRHVQDLQTHYSDGSKNNNFNVLFVNLIDRKKDQGRLGIKFSEVVQDMASQLPDISLKYEWFDFHGETKKKGGYKNLSTLVSNVKDTFAAHSFFCRLPNGSVSSYQRGVIRTNCMDNLDRTNVAQSLFARCSLLSQLGREDMLKQTKYCIDTEWKSFEKIYKSIWANNANSMSLSYAGTGALKVDFTKTGKRTLKGMWNDGVNACMRYYINNFLDGSKQDSIDLLVGNYQVDCSAPSPFTPRPDQDSLTDFATKAFVLTIFVFSTLFFVTPFLSPWLGGLDPKALSVHVSLLSTLLIVMYSMYVILKKGSKVGERLVRHPQLLPDSIPH